VKEQLEKGSRQQEEANESRCREQEIGNMNEVKFERCSEEAKKRRKQRRKAHYGAKRK
jgi:hypothetical protein